jgi:hypothetical protein
LKWSLDTIEVIPIGQMEAWMNSKLEKLTKTALIGAALSFAWLIFNLAALIRIKQRIPSAEAMGDFIYLGLVAAFFIHVFALIILTRIFKIMKKISTLGLLTLFTGVISVISLFSDWAALNDIGHDFMSGASASTEWLAVLTGWGIHTAFYGLFTLFTLQTLRRIRKESDEKLAAADEALFLAVHFAGLICSLVGLGLVFWGLFVKASPRIWAWILLPYSIFILFPYGLFLASWVIQHRRERLSQWHDEKQAQDIGKAAFSTLLLSIPGLGALFIYQVIAGAAGILWFPYSIFLTLFIFSGCIILYFRK